MTGTLAIVNDRVYAYGSGDPTAFGGAERQQWLLARAMAAVGWNVLVGVRRGMSPGARETIDGVHYVGMGGGRLLLDWYRFLSSERPDWWYWRCASHMWGPAVQVAKLARVRTVFAAGFDRDLVPRQALVGEHRYWWPLYVWGLSGTDRILLQHTGQRAHLSTRLLAKAHVVRSIAPLPPHPLPHASRPPRVAWMAMLREAKRPDLLVEIARRLPDVPFVVCGRASSHRSAPGYGARMIETLRALPNVDYRGQVSPEEAERVIAEAAVLLSTSDLEGFPNTFLQAWSSGTPVVSLKVDPDEAITRAELGKLSRTVEQAVTDLEALLGAPSERDAMGARGRGYVNQVHGEREVAKAFALALSLDPGHNRGNA